MYAATAVYLNPDVYVACEDGDITIELFRNTYGLRMNMEDFPAHYEEMKDYLKQEKKKAESLLNGIKPLWHINCLFSQKENRYSR